MANLGHGEVNNRVNTSCRTTFVPMSVLCGILVFVILVIEIDQDGSSTILITGLVVAILQRVRGAIAERALRGVLVAHSEVVTVEEFKFDNSGGWCEEVRFSLDVCAEAKGVTRSEDMGMTREDTVMVQEGSVARVFVSNAYGLGFEVDKDLGMIPADNWALEQTILDSRNPQLSLACSADDDRWFLAVQDDSSFGVSVFGFGVLKREMDANCDISVVDGQKVMSLHGCVRYSACR